MPIDQPFQQLFETFGKLPDAHAEAVNRKARETLKECLDVPLQSSGHCILLKAPRAGHGKTHLLTRLQHELGGSHEFVPLRAVSGSRIDAATVLDDTLRRLVRGLPAAGGLTVLDLVTRRLFASSLQPLVNSGEVPCQDREGAINALRTRPIETFDFHHPSAVTAHWARENFELLGPRLALELSQRDGISLREVSFWVDAMFRFASTPIDNPGRVRALAMTVFENPAAEASAHERLVALLGLLTTLMRVVLVADEVEGFSSDETAALRFASFIGALRQSANRVEIVISVNEDVWKSAFLPRLSGGLSDRLSEIVVELEPLDREGMIAILDSRSPGSGEKILSEMGPASVPTHARGVIKAAANASRSEPDTSVASIPAQSEKQKEMPSSFAATAPDSLPEPEKPGIAAPSLFASAQEFAAVTSKPDFSADGFSASTKPSEPSGEGKFSAEAAIAAFAAVKQSELGSMETPPAPSESPPEPDFSAAPPAPSSWPSSGVSEPPSQSAPMFETSPVSAFKAPPVSEPEVFAPAQERVSGLQTPPASVGETPAFTFQHAPEPSNDPVSAFQAPPEQTAPSAFDAAPLPTGFLDSAPPQEKAAALAPASQPLATPPAQPAEEKQESATDRVDDLLRQFRERYGKSQ